MIRLFFSLLFAWAVFINVSAAYKSDSLAIEAEKNPSNLALNFDAGRALYEDGQHTRSAGFFQKAGVEAIPWLALLEFEKYRFDEARALASRYLAGKHEVASAEERLAQDVIGRVTIAEGMLDRVEKTVVIDSVIVPKEEFFKAYNIDPTTGKLLSGKSLPRQYGAGKGDVVYMSEDGDYAIWGKPNDSGVIELVEINQLTDGKWDSPNALGSHLGLGGNAAYPFLMTDGITLYYASDGEGALGGYDIYVTRNDGDKYLNPQNLGMPYNSPMDDYLLVIDDATGIGWWATDRNLIPDSLTIYVFVPQELRDNYPVTDTPDLINMARLHSISKTIPAGVDFSDKKKMVKTVYPSNEIKSNPSVGITLPDGRRVYTPSHLSEPKAVDAMGIYNQALKNFDLKERRLDALRREYSKGNHNVEREILDAESDIEEARKQLRSLANEVIKEETH